MQISAFLLVNSVLFQGAEGFCESLESFSSDVVGNPVFNLNLIQPSIEPALHKDSVAV
jgi:hypothetical protein